MVEDEGKGSYENEIYIYLDILRRLYDLHVV